MVRHAVDLVAQLLDVDRRTNQGRAAFEREWPVVLSVPITPMEADALRFLSSLYPANPAEIVRAAVLPYLDPGSTPPRVGDDGLGTELTSRVELFMDTSESGALDALAEGASVDAVAMARAAMWGTLGPLLDVPRP
jgi:hypothetical protein